MKQMFIFLLVLCTLGNNVKADPFIAPGPLLEAQLLAMDISGALQPSPQLTQRILNDLAAIRAAFPEVADVRYRPAYAPDRIIIGLTDAAAAQFRAGNYHGLDKLNELYGVIAIDSGHLAFAGFLILKLDRTYNVPLLSEIYRQTGADGLGYAEPDYVVGDGSTICAEPPDYIFRLGWGDCPAGCTHNEYRHFSVDNGVVTVQPVIHYVDATTGSDINHGFTPDKALAHIQAAINRASDDGDTIVVLAATYYENIDLMGKRLRLAAAEGPKVTIIDGNGVGPVIRCASGEEPSAVIEGFTVTGGDAALGGAMYNYNGSPTVINCAFTRNSAERGGAIYNENGSPAFFNCTFGENASDYGAGMYNYSSSVALANCTFWRNDAAGRGAGIFDCEGDLVLTNCTFSQNDSVEPGSALCAWYGSRPIVSNCIFRDAGPVEIYAQAGVDVGVAYSNIREGLAGEDNIDADPLFVDPNKGNLRLRPDSPCIDAGDNNAVPVDYADLDGDGDTEEPTPFDLAAKPRIAGPAVDMGAYEYPILSAFLDIRPHTLNLKSRGKWILCSIRLPEGRDFRKLDCSSILLEDRLQPVRVRLHNKGRLLTAKFSRGDLKQLLEPGRAQLTVTGELSDGTRFEAKDMLSVVSRGR